MLSRDAEVSADFSSWLRMPQNGPMLLGMADPLPPFPTAQDLIRPDGKVVIDDLLEVLRLSRAELALALDLPEEALSERSRLETPETQRRLRDLIEVLVQVVPWTGSFSEAYAWVSTRPLPSFGGRTAADLLREDRVETAASYVFRVAQGGYAGGGPDGQAGGATGMVGR
ncbi:XRE family transcriptional regulator [Limimaricola cinnabarinus]|uniref:Antitoxin Xre/MbcA/ParS-like toxin-binding domain-containing protein n=1 Tax=Limimaricola cinnabarinus TaxID=1125964 RepID=A0A2G1MCQ1_9RHOB|nr:XRE family transcriptional regulator [Limimaricola cinnabarinus]PHP26523.1 hypothetical protein CJ301_15865 [Limimaricola cinnabarinus]